MKNRIIAKAEKKNHSRNAVINDGCWDIYRDETGCKG